MPQCTTDFTPLIIALAGVVSVQIPLLVTHFINASQARHDARVIKGVVWDNNKKVDELTLITKNGYHGPPGPQGPPGPPSTISGENPYHG